MKGIQETEANFLVIFIPSTVPQYHGLTVVEPWFSYQQHGAATWYHGHAIDVKKNFLELSRSKFFNGINFFKIAINSLMC